MKGIQGSREQRSKLDGWMDERRLELRITWTEVARRAGMTAQNLIRIRKDRIRISWDAADGIEDALLWTRGSIEAAVTRGERPTSRTDEPSEGGPLVGPDLNPSGAPQIIDPATATLADLHGEYVHFMELLPPAEMDRLYALCELYHHLQLRISRQSEGGERPHAQGDY